ncbi:MAG: universal stress protein, partial [Corynebacterium glutamicum]|nr:universal stress protein [Corynebacterium glutamicum]
MKTIITGVDSSQTALAAAEKAAELAASFDA